MQTFNSNLKELGVVESKRNAIRRGFVHELLNAQDTVLCSYFAQRAGTKNDGCGQKSTVDEAFQPLEIRLSKVMPMATIVEVLQSSIHNVK